MLLDAKIMFSNLLTSMNICHVKNGLTVNTQFETLNVTETKKTLQNVIMWGYSIGTVGACTGF